MNRKEVENYTHFLTNGWQQSSEESDIAHPVEFFDHTLWTEERYLCCRNCEGDNRTIVQLHKGDDTFSRAYEQSTTWDEVMQLNTPRQTLVSGPCITDFRRLDWHIVNNATVLVLGEPKTEDIGRILSVPDWNFYSTMQKFVNQNTTAVLCQGKYKYDGDGNLYIEQTNGTRILFQNFVFLGEVVEKHVHKDSLIRDYYARKIFSRQTINSFLITTARIPTHIKRELALMVQLVLLCVLFVFVSPIFGFWF